MNSGKPDQLRSCWQPWAKPAVHRRKVQRLP